MLQREPDLKDLVSFDLFRHEGRDLPYRIFDKRQQVRGARVGSAVPDPYANPPPSQTMVGPN